MGLTELINNQESIKVTPIIKCPSVNSASERHMIVIIIRIIIALLH